MKNFPLPPSEDLVPEYIRKLIPYRAGKPVSELLREKNLKRVSKLASNENPLGPSPFAIKEMTQALWELHRYPDMHAFELKKSLSELYKLKAENIILGNGSEGIMSYIVRTFLGQGDEVLTSEKTFIGFYILARTVGANLKMVPLNDKFKFDVEKMSQAITERTKIIYIANPNNPTGTYLQKDEFDYLMEHVPNRTLVILDEAYFEFAIGHSDFPDSMDYRYDNVITLRTFSKAYGLAGIRVGYGFGHEDLISHFHKIKLPFEPNLIAQAGAIGALQDRPHLDRTLENNKLRYSQILNYLKAKKITPIPSVCNFVTIKTQSVVASEYIYENLLNLGVIVRPLASNEMPDFLRISLGSEQEMNHFYESFDIIYPNIIKKFGPFEIFENL